MSFFLWLYNIALWLGVVFAAPVWLLYLALIPKARAGFFQKLGCLTPAWEQTLSQLPTGQKRIWIHAVSVGELNAIRPLIQDLADEFTIMLSTTTKTAQQLAQRIYPQHTVFYFPFDFRRVIHKMVRLLKPDILVLTETELWPNIIDVLSRQYHIAVVLINGRISKRSYRGYHFIKLLMEVTLGQLNHCFMQCQSDANRIKALGELPAEHITVVGNLKFDIHPVIDPIQKNILSHLLSFDSHATVLVFASTHSGEDAPFLDTFLRLKKDFPELKLILAPRHPERRDEIRNILNMKVIRYSLRSQLSEASPNQEDIVLLDSIGELVTVYSLSSIAVLGGSFVEKGGQNPLEPMSQGLPVIFGPDMSNFSEISQMILEQDAGYQAKTYEDLGQQITELLTQPELRSTLVENGQQLLENNRGAKEILSISIRQRLLYPHGDLMAFD